jgi:hypothetical protein
VGWRCATLEDPGRRRIVLENKGEMGPLTVRRPEVAGARRDELSAPSRRTTEDAEGTEGVWCWCGGLPPRSGSRLRDGDRDRRRGP